MQQAEQVAAAGGAGGGSGTASVSLPRCVCGLSKAFPMCDGSHATKAWAPSTTEPVRFAICAGGRYSNLAVSLASGLGVAAVTALALAPSEVDTLVVRAARPALRGCVREHGWGWRSSSRTTWTPHLRWTWPP